MGDNPHQPLARRQLLEHLDRLFQRIFIQRAKSLVNKHGIQLHAAAPALDHVGQAQSQGQRGLKCLAARKGFHAPLFPRIVVNHIQFQPGFAAVVLRHLLLYQLKSTVCHLIQPAVGPGDNLSEKRPLRIALKGNLCPAVQLSIGGVRQFLLEEIALLRVIQRLGPRLTALRYSSVCL